MHPSDLLRALRRRHGLTQATLAARAGLSRSSLSDYETGRTDPTIGTLAKIVAAAGECLELTTDVATSGLVPPATLEEHGRRLLDVLTLVDALPPRPVRRTLVAPRMVSL